MLKETVKASDWFLLLVTVAVRLPVVWFLAIMETLGKTDSKNGLAPAKSLDFQ